MVVAAETAGWAPLWQDWGITIQNGIVFLLLVAIALLVWKASTLPDWVSAARQLRVQRLPMIALIIFVAYALIGVLDSISWRDVTRDNKGVMVLAPDGRPVLQSQPSPLVA
jgi:hypothetical protein